MIRQVLKILALALAAVGPGAGGVLAQADDRPMNVIVILIDDLGWADLSCQGSGFYQTPNIDRLASQGVRFTQAYAACVVCSPTRAAILTGRHPARTGVTDWIRPNLWKQMRGAELPSLPGYTATEKQRLACPMNRTELPLEEVTLPELLKPAGYVTGHIGKWHLGDEGFWPEHQGFDVNLAGTGFGAPPSYFDPYADQRVPEGFPTLEARKAGEYLTDREADEAVSFIRQNKDRPFFLNLWHHAVHTPIQAKPEVVKLYEGRPTTNQTDTAYAAMIHSVDESIGRVMATLDELSLDDKTLVVFTSDNGGLDSINGKQAGRPTDNAPLRWGKGHPYEGGVRVPMIVRWPGVSRAGSVEQYPVMSMDVFATALDAAGVERPDNRSTDGMSLRLLLGGTADYAPRTLYWHFPHYGGDFRIPNSAIRDGDWKLIRFYDSDHVELYNLAEDLAEERNVATSRPDLVEQLTAKLDTWLKETGAKMPRPNPVYSGL